MVSSGKPLIGKLAGLETLNRAELVDRWLEAYGTPPFKGARRSTLIRGLAYHLQCKTYGGLKPSVSRELLKIAAGGSVKQAEQCSKSQYDKTSCMAAIISAELTWFTSNNGDAGNRKLNEAWFREELETGIKFRLA